MAFWIYWAPRTFRSLWMFLISFTYFTLWRLFYYYIYTISLRHSFNIILLLTYKALWSSWFHIIIFDIKFLDFPIRLIRLCCSFCWNWTMITYFSFTKNWLSSPLNLFILNKIFICRNFLIVFFYIYILIFIWRFNSNTCIIIFLYFFIFNLID